MPLGTAVVPLVKKMAAKVSSSSLSMLELSLCVDTPFVSFPFISGTSAFASVPLAAASFTSTPLIAESWNSTALSASSGLPLDVILATPSNHIHF